MKLKPFQQTAITELRKKFLTLWETGNKQLPLTFKAPTGSGKTVVMAHFLRDLVNDPQFDADRAYVWVSFSEESYEQSKKKFFEYYGGASELQLTDLNDLKEKKLKKNEIFFINWQKLKSTSKENRLLRREGEQNTTFDEFIRNTQEDGREIVLLIDEAHRDASTTLADDLVELISPRIIVHVTATPINVPSREDEDDGKAGYVYVRHEDVIEQGLIKEKIVVQTKEDFAKVTEDDQDRMLLEMAYNKRLELLRAYQEIDEDINPLVLIQLPSDESEKKDVETESKLETVKRYLKQKGVKENEIAVWLSKEKENLEAVESNRSSVQFLIFKQAAATGWDCPRASILVMFREVKSPIFHEQTVGRILRMPRGYHYATQPLINIAYLYTNYKKNEIKLPEGTKNKATSLISNKRKGVENIDLESIYLSRTDYGDLGASFQTTFAEVADSELGITGSDILTAKLAKVKKKFELKNFKLNNRLIVDAEIKVYDDFIKEIRKSDKELEHEISHNDLEKLFNLYCYEILTIQEDNGKKYAPERSWGTLKSALRVWIKSIVDSDSYEIYKILVNDMAKKEKSELRHIIDKALAVYGPVRREEIEAKQQFAMSQAGRLWNVPDQLSYTDEYEALEQYKLAAMAPCYIRKEYTGRINETAFMDFLEANSEKIAWWYKNGDHGSEHFAVPYENRSTHTVDAFYVDFIVQFKDGRIGLFDTKKKQTVESFETIDKSKGLYAYIQKWNKQGKNIVGGIVANIGGIWKCDNESVDGFEVNDNTSWVDFMELL